MTRPVLALLAFACFLGCQEADVEIVGSCVPVGEATRLAGPGSGILRGLGLLDGQVLLVRAFVVDPADESSDIRYEAQWFDSELSAMGDPVPLGSGRPVARSEITRIGDELVGVFLVDPGGAIPAGPEQDYVGLWHFAPGRAPERTPVDLPFGRLECPSCRYYVLGIGGLGLAAGREGALPITPNGAAVLSGIGPGCVGDGANLFRLLTFDATRAAAVDWRETPCDPSGGDGLPQIVRTREGYGVLFRQNDQLERDIGDLNIYPVYYVAVDERFELRAGPVRVGEAFEHPWRIYSGYQPKAASLGVGDRLIFNEMTEMRYRCQILRMLESDGSNARRSPWQLPCLREPTQFHTTSSDLVEMPDGMALVVWGERDAQGGDLGGYAPVEDRSRFNEGIHLALITPDGRRGSDVVRVTDANATVLPEWDRPVPRDFLVHVAVDGWDVLVGWHDTRTSAPGFYVRKLRCGVEP